MPNLFYSNVKLLNRGADLLLALAGALSLASFTACGGGASTGTGGGGGNPPPPPAPAISLLSPSKVMLGVPLGIVTVFGTNFTSDATVFSDGAPLVTRVVSSTALEAQIPNQLDYTAKTYQFNVGQASGTSNKLPWIDYVPTQGPQPFAAISGYDPGGSDSADMTVVDVNGDGRADVVMPGPAVAGQPTVAVMLGLANGQLAPPTLTPGVNPGPIVCGDVNGDGLIDIVTATTDANNQPIISVLLNDGTGKFNPGSTVSYVGSYPGSMTLVDVNGDGKPDLVFSANLPSTIYLLLNQGGTFASPVAIASPPAENRTFSIADFNGDGLPDIVYVVANAIAGQDQIHLLTNLGGGIFSDGVPQGIWRGRVFRSSGF